MDSMSLASQTDEEVQPDTVEDVFGGGNGPHLGQFHCNPSGQPTEAPQNFFQEFTLPPVNFLVSEENLQEPSILKLRTCDKDQASIQSFSSAQSDDQANTFGLCKKIQCGKAREAPTMLLSAAALKDVQEYLRGKPKGKGGGFHQPDLDPFLRSRMEGLQSFLSLYSDPQSVTYEKWAPSSVQAAITLGHSTYCARNL